VASLPARPRPSALDGIATYLGAPAGVDLWSVGLDAPAHAGGVVLDAAERARAARFAFERDRRRFVAGRAALRAVLAAYVDTPAGALAFTVGPHGKPALPGGPPFSFSNSQGCGLCAVGVDREVGVDVERLREVPDAASIARSVFTPEERQAWQDAGGGGGAAFLRVWTRKEAALKAMGVGLGALDHGGAPTAALLVLDLDLDAYHAAALAVLG
jgi:4'-phosphopantetheinyl transferase